MLLRERFPSIEEYAAGLGHTDVRVLALGRERRAWTSCRTDLDGIVVRCARDGGACVFDGAINADVVGLLVCADDTGKMIGDGAVFGPGTVMVVPQRREVRVVSLDTVEWNSALIPTSLLSRTPDEQHALRDLRCGVMGPPIAAAATFRTLLMRIAKIAMTGGFDANPLVAKDASRQLVAAARTLLEASSEWPAVVRRQGRHRVSRVAVIHLIDQWLEDAPDPKVSLHDLADVAGVSHRTLHSVFVEQLGVSPKRYLRLRLLNAVRRELTSANPADIQVTDAMSRLGVWDWGRFSGEYDALFGELPSETLRRLGRR